MDEPIDYRSKDAVLYDKWKETKSKKDMGALVKQLSPLIYKEVRRQSGTLPVDALTAEAKKWTVHAIKTYDPSKGAALSTYLYKYLQKVRRMNYQYQNAVRLPENLQRQYGDYNRAVTSLEEVLSREPTDKEIASKLGWKPAQVTKYRGSLYDDLYESGTDRATEHKVFNSDKMRFNYIQDNLTPEESIILSNVKKVSSPQLAKKLKVNVNKLNYMKKKLRTKIQGLQQDFGEY